MPRANRGPDTGPTTLKCTRGGRGAGPSTAAKRRLISGHLRSVPWALDASGENRGAHAPIGTAERRYTGAAESGVQPEGGREASAVHVLGQCEAEGGAELLAVHERRLRKKTKRTSLRSALGLQKHLTWLQMPT